MLTSGCDLIRGGPMTFHAHFVNFMYVQQKNNAFNINIFRRHFQNFNKIEKKMRHAIIYLVLYI